MPTFIESLILRLVDKRQPAACQEITINRHQLYILPTRSGMTYLIVLLLTLAGSINYENSLGFMLSFLLGAMGFLSMIYTHQNINQLNIKAGRAEPVFAEQIMSFPIYLSSNNNKTYPNIKLLSNSGITTTAHIINGSETQCKLQIKASHRGYVSIGRIKLFSEFPMGLFHAWSWLKLDSQCLVYPAPDTHRHALQFEKNQGQGFNNSHQQGVDDFAGIRQYHDGDLPNHMAWKAIAKTGHLQTKLFTNDCAKKIWINWLHTNEAFNIEQRLSILCRMVLDAHDNNIVYGLQIPETIISPSSGLQHKQRCLKALALFGHE